MEDHLNSNIQQNVPLSVYEELYQELEGMNHLSNTGRAGGSRRGYATLDMTTMGVDVEEGPITQPIKDTNKMSESRKLLSYTGSWGTVIINLTRS